MTNSSYVKVTYPKKSIKDCNLKPGDICGFKSGSACHTMVYAGRNSSGKMTWYSAGGSDYNRRDLTKITKSTYTSNTKAATLIRIK